MGGATVDDVTISTWRATTHLVAGAALAVTTGIVFALVILLWGAAIDSLIEGPTGYWYLPLAYVVAVPGGLLVLLWCSRRFAAAQRTRFGRTLGVPIATPAVTGRWFIRPWRPLAYHVVAMALAVPAALSIVVPPAARRLARADLTLARVLLGPSRAERLQQRVESLAQSRADVIAATDAERRRIERDLHDGAQQRLVSLAMNLGMARAAMTDGAGPRPAIAAAHDEAMPALTELREFVRGLHPAVLNDRGLDAALSGVAARAPLPVKAARRRAAAMLGDDRGDRLLHRLGGADQRGQARRRDRGRGDRAAARRDGCASRSPTTAGRRAGVDSARRAARAGAAGRGGRRHADRAQPRRRADDHHRGAAMRVVLAEDSVLLRAGLTKLLTDGGFEVVAAVGDAEELLRAVAEHLAPTSR